MNTLNFYPYPNPYPFLATRRPLCYFATYASGFVTRQGLTKLNSDPFAWQISLHFTAGYRIHTDEPAHFWESA